MTAKREIRAGNAHVAITPSDWQDEASIQADFDSSFELLDELQEQGVQEWQSQYRRIGPFKIAVYKEVGPPPWRFPRICVDFKRSPLTVGAAIGWRTTLYGFMVMWKRKR